MANFADRKRVLCECIRSLNEKSYDLSALRKRTESTSNLIQSIEDEQTRLEQVNAILVADDETEEYQIKVRRHNYVHVG